MLTVYPNRARRTKTQKVNVQNKGLNKGDDV